MNKKTNEPWGNTVLVEFEDGIAWITLNRPDKKNAMNPTMGAEMRATLEALIMDERCGVLVLTGAGDSFAAGMDLQEYFRDTDEAGDEVILQARRINEEWQWRRLRDYPKPTIAMVNGWCFGGGLRPGHCRGRGDIRLVRNQLGHTTRGQCHQGGGRNHGLP